VPERAEQGVQQPVCVPNTEAGRGVQTSAAIAVQLGKPSSAPFVASLVSTVAGKATAAEGGGGRGEV